MFLMVFARHGNNIRPHGYPPKLTSVGYGFGFSPILKHGYETDNGVICTHPESIPIPVPNVKNYFMLDHVMLFGLLILML